MKNSEQKDDRQRGYVKKHYEARKAEGKVKCSFWLEPAAAEALAYLMANNPQLTKAGAINGALVYIEKKAREAEEVLGGIKHPGK